LAWELARAGQSVLLLEKKKLPRYKTCGGGLTRRAAALLPFDIGNIVEDRAHTVRLRVHHRTVFARTGPPAVHLVMRDTFDHYLARKAVAAGAELRDQTRFLSLSGPPGDLSIETSAGPVRARMVAGADGAHSRVARALDLPLSYHVMPALEAELTLPPKTLARFKGSLFFDFGVIPGGYAWIFPKKDHLSAGILARRRPARQLQPFFNAYLQANGLDQARVARPVRLHPIPCRPDGRNRYAGERGLVVGDATGLVDAVTGEGLFYALQSARLAARAIRRHLDNPKGMIARYNGWIKANIEAEVLRSDRLARILYGFPALSDRILARHGDKIGAKHIAVYLGEISYHQLYRYILSPRGVAYLLQPRRKTKIHRSA
jgi:geranylgeranyl reductase family protein